MTEAVSPPYFLATLNNAAVTVCIQIFVWMYVFISVGCRPGSEIVGSYGNSV